MFVFLVQCYCHPGKYYFFKVASKCHRNLPKHGFGQSKRKELKLNKSRIIANLIWDLLSFGFCYVGTLLRFMEKSHKEH